MYCLLILVIRIQPSAPLRLIKPGLKSDSGIPLAHSASRGGVALLINGAIYNIFISLSSTSPAKLPPVENKSVQAVGWLVGWCPNSTFQSSSRLYAAYILLGDNSIDQGDRHKLCELSHPQIRFEQNLKTRHFRLCTSAPWRGVTFRFANFASHFKGKCHFHFLIR